VILFQRTEVDHQSQRRNESISQRDARVSARPPVVWAALLALVLILFNQHFPASIEDSLRLLGSATGGVALFASGITCCFAPRRFQPHRNRPQYRDTSRDMISPKPRFRPPHFVSW